VCHKRRGHRNTDASAKLGGVRDDIFTEVHVPALTGFPAMPSARESSPARLLLALGAAFTVMGWALHAVLPAVLPDLDDGASETAATLVGLIHQHGAQRHHDQPRRVGRNL
jgi:hypothetical protein